MYLLNLLLDLFELFAVDQHGVPIVGDLILAAIYAKMTVVFR